MEFIKKLTSREKLINNTIIIEIQDMYDFYENKCIGIFKVLQKDYPEIKFVSLMGIDLYGNGTEEKIPIKIFLEKMILFIFLRKYLLSCRF